MSGSPKWWRMTTVSAPGPSAAKLANFASKVASVNGRSLSTCTVMPAISKWRRWSRTQLSLAARFSRATAQRCSTLAPWRPCSRYPYTSHQRQSSRSSQAAQPSRYSRPPRTTSASDGMNSSQAVCTAPGAHRRTPRPARALPQVVAQRRVLDEAAEAHAAVGVDVEVAAASRCRRRRGGRRRARPGAVPPCPDAAGRRARRPRPPRPRAPRRPRWAGRARRRRPARAAAARSRRCGARRRRPT